MKKAVFHSRVTSVTVILTLALCIGSGIFGMAKAVELISVKAGESDVSGSDSVSPTETEPDDVTKKGAAVVRDITGHLYAYEVPPEKSVNFEMTHTVTTNGGKSKTTKTPAHMSAGDVEIFNLYNVGGDYSTSGTYDRHNQLSHSTAQASFSGVLENGEAVGIQIPARFASNDDFYGSFSVTLSDGSTVSWPCAITRHNTEHNYEFDFANDIGTQLPEGVTVTKYDINIPLNTAGIYPVSVTRNSISTTVQLKSVDEDSAWDNLYASGDIDASAAAASHTAGWKDTQLGTETLTFASDSATELSGYAAHGARFYIEEINSGRRISNLTVTNSDSGSDVTSSCVTRVNGKYVITMPDYAVSVAVESEALPKHKLVIEANTPDYIMNGIQQADSKQADSVYGSDATKLRFSNANCTSARTNGKETGRSSSYSKITVTDYYKYGDYSWWTTVFAYTHDGKLNLSNPNGETQYISITNVRFYREENAELHSVTPESVGFSSGVYYGRPYIRFVPQNYDMKVTFDVVERPEGYSGYHTIFLHEKRPTVEDTVWCNYFRKVSDNLFTFGSKDKNSYYTDSTECYNNANPMAFPGVENTFRVARFKADSIYTYSLYYVNSRQTNSTLVKSWKVYKANADGSSTGEEVTLANGTNVLSFAGYDEGDYLVANGNSSTNKSIFSGARFKMPDFDIVIDVEFAKTVAPCEIAQQIVDENGSYQPITEDIPITFTGTPRDTETHAFYEGDSVTVSAAKNYIGYYKGTKDVSFTANPPEGYVVSNAEYYFNFAKSNKYTDFVRSGNTFTIPNSSLLKENSSGQPTYSDGVGFGVTVRYSKFIPVTVNQQTDGTTMPGSDAAVGTVTLTCQNSGTFLDPSLTGSPATSFVSVLNKSQSSVTSSVMSSMGSKLSLNVKVSDSSRVIESVEIIRRRSGVDETLEVDPTKYVQNEATYNLSEGLGIDDELTVNVRYKTVQRLTVDIVVKNPSNNSGFTANNTSATATVTAVGSTSGDSFEKFPIEAGSACDSFTVSNDPAKYLTRGNIPIRLEIGNLPEGYVVANVMAAPMKENGDYNNSATSNAINPTNIPSEEYDNLRSYSTCTMTIPDGQNYYIRVFLAKTATVTARICSRGSSLNALFEDNAVSNTYIVYSQDNANYGVNFFPVIITNGTNRYNTDAYVVSTDPATRTVDVAEKTTMTGNVTVPKGYILASVTATRSNGGSATPVNVSYLNSAYKSDKGVDLLQMVFSLSDSLEGGYHYYVTINVEQATTVKLRSMHTNENGEFVPNTFNNSQSTLYNTRGSAEADAPYNLTDYQSAGSFTGMTGNNVTINANYLLTIKSEPERECYVLRNSDFTVLARPIDGEEVASVLVYDADVPDTKYECELIEELSNGNLRYSVPMKSFMNGELVVEVNYTAQRTFGNLTIVNKDINGNEINTPGTVSLTLKNSIFTKPGHVANDSAWFASTQMTGSRQTYEITMGSTVKLDVNGGGYIRLSHMTLDGSVRHYSDNKYSVNITLREGETVTVENYYSSNAVVRQSVYYSDLGGNVDPPVIRFNNQSSYIGLSSYGFYVKDGEQYSYKAQETSGNPLIEYFPAGQDSEFHTVVREQAGYVLEKLVLYVPGGGEYVLTRDQIASGSINEKGTNSIDISWDDIRQGSLTAEQLALLKQSFKQLMPENTYEIEAYFTTRVIHVQAKELSYEEFERINEEEEGGFAEYVKTHTVGSYHDPDRVAHANAWSIDGKNNVNYISNHQNGDMGVRPGSSPTITVCSQYKKQSDTTVYYRVGAVFYGALNLQTPRVLPTTPPVPFGMGVNVNSEPVNEDMYLTVIYIVYTEKNIKPPGGNEATYDDSGTVWKNTGLTVNFFLHDDATGEDNIISDPDILSQMNAKLAVEQNCVGYHYQSSDESAKHSNASNHANYVPDPNSSDPNDVPIIYEHHDDPVLCRLVTGEEGASWDTVIPALIGDEKDGAHPTQGYTVKADPVSIDSGHVRYSVLSNNIDQVKVSLTMQPPENFILDRMEINNGDGKLNVSDEYNYEYTVSGSVDEKVLTYYFRRPTIEVFTNNAAELNLKKGTIKVVSGEENSSVGSDDVIVNESSDYSRSTQYDAGKVLKLIAIPEEGYYVAEVRCGSPLENNGDIPLVPPEQIVDFRSSAGKKLITLGSFNEKLLRVVVNFRKIGGDTYVPLTVSQFVIASDGAVTPINTGTVVINGTHSDSSVTNTIISGEHASNSVTLQDASMLTADVYVGTELSIKPTAPAGYTLATDSGFFDSGVTPPEIPIHAFYTEESNNHDIGYTLSGVTYTLNEVGGESVMQDGRSVTVNIYYYQPTFEVKYIDNLAPTAVHTDFVTCGGNTVIKSAADLDWSHDGYTFSGWTADPATTEYIKDPGSTITVISNVTYTANWSAVTYTVTYKDSLDNSVSDTSNVQHGGSHTVKSIAALGWTHEGYTFSGWTVNPATYSNTAGSSITVTSDVTYTANWTIKTYRILYVLVLSQTIRLYKERKTSEK